MVGYTYIVAAVSEQRAWIESLPAGTFFRSADVPARSPGAAATFLAREAAKPSPQSICRRVAANLYQVPHRDSRGYAKEPPYLDIARALTGPGCGLSGHAAGRYVGWLTHVTAEPATVAVVGEPTTRAPLATLRLRPRSNHRRRELAPIEVTYIEAVSGYDRCAEMNWSDAVALAAANESHRRQLRPALILDVGGAERGPGARLLRRRLHELCDALTSPPPVGARGGGPSVYARASLAAADLPAWMARTPGARIGALATFVNQWARDEDARADRCADAPVGTNRLDLVRVAATVHALCDRDGVPVPSWVWTHRWHEDVAIHPSIRVTATHERHAPAACRYHRVWFLDDHITNIHVHTPGGRTRST